MIDDLHLRQVRLREVGIKGQQRIAEAHVALGADEASRVAAGYLERAGVGRVQLLDSGDTRSFVRGKQFTHEVCRTFAHGCWLATNTLVDVIGLAGAKSGY